MTFYRHLHPDLSRDQQQNFIRLGHHLVLATRDAKWDPGLEFSMGDPALDLTTGDYLEPDQVAAHIGPLLCNPLGYAPRADITALPGETWRAYQARVLGAEFDSPLEDWLLSVFWRHTDNTPTGAAMRLMYVLDYGVPGDFEAIRDGQAESDYLTNGFLWDRIGLSPTP